MKPDDMKMVMEVFNVTEKQLADNPRQPPYLPKKNIYEKVNAAGFKSDEILDLWKGRKVKSLYKKAMKGAPSPKKNSVKKKVTNKYEINGRGNCIQLFKLTDEQKQHIIDEELSSYDAIDYCEEEAEPAGDWAGPWFNEFVELESVDDPSIKLTMTDFATDVVDEPNCFTVDNNDSTGFEDGTYLLFVQEDRGYWGTAKLPKDKSELTVMTYALPFIDADIVSHFWNKKDFDYNMELDTITKAEYYYICEIDDEGEIGETFYSSQDNI